MQKLFSAIFAGMLLLLLFGCVLPGNSLARGTDADGNHWQGAQKASVTVYEYSDFECPACKAAEPSVASFASKYQSRNTRVVYRHFPLEEIHPQARLAAIASECAGMQGKFWEYHDVLFKNSPKLSREDLLSYAQSMNLSPLFEGCLSDPSASAIVDSDIASGMSLGLRGTPSFQVNDVSITGTDNLDARLSQLVEKALSSG